MQSVWSVLRGVACWCVVWDVCGVWYVVWYVVRSVLCGVCGVVCGVVVWLSSGLMLYGVWWCE